MLKPLLLICILFPFSVIADKYTSETLLKKHPLKETFTIENKLIMKMFDSRGICDKLPPQSELPKFCYQSYKKIVEKAALYGFVMDIEDFRSATYKSLFRILDRTEVVFIDNYSKSVNYDHKKTTPFKKSLRKKQREAKKVFLNKTKANQ